MTLRHASVDIGDEADRIMNEPTLTSQELTEECAQCPPLKAHAEEEDDDFEDVFANRNAEDEEAARIMNELSSQEFW